MRRFSTSASYSRHMTCNVTYVRAGPIVHIFCIPLWRGFIMKLSSTIATALLAVYAQSAFATQVAGFNGNACRHSSGGTFLSDTDGGISNASTTETMIIHCSVWLPRDVPITAGVVLTQPQSTQPISCTIEERSFACGGICQATTIFRKVLARMTSSYFNGYTDRAAFIAEGGSTLQFTADAYNDAGAADSYHYVRCTIPAKQNSTAAPSNIKAFRFWTTP